jgi:hypothetical protein
VHGRRVNGAPDKRLACQAEAKLAALTAARPRPADPGILDEIPYAEDILCRLPPASKHACSPPST